MATMRVAFDGVKFWSIVFMELIVSCVGFDVGWYSTVCYNGNLSLFGEERPTKCMHAMGSQPRYGAFY